MRIRLFFKKNKRNVIIIPPFLSSQHIMLILYPKILPLLWALIEFSETSLATRSDISCSRLMRYGSSTELLPRAGIFAIKLLMRRQITGVQRLVSWFQGVAYRFFHVLDTDKRCYSVWSNLGHGRLLNTESVIHYRNQWIIWNEVLYVTLPRIFDTYDDK